MPASATDLCRELDTSLESFLVRFADDKAFQLDRIAYPLRMKYTPPASERSVLEKWPRSRVEKIDWPLFLSVAELTRWKYVQTVQMISPDKAVVKHDSGSDNYFRTFIFRNRGGCWYLEHVSDNSL